jgi:hypothetical protein
VSLNSDIFLLIIGGLIGMIIPRIPALFFSRFPHLERDLPPHPDPLPINVSLIQRMLLIRRLHNMGWVLVLLPLLLSYLVLEVSPEPFALGLMVGSGWWVLSRLVPTASDPIMRGPLPMALIQRVNEFRQPKQPCCEQCEPQFEVRAIRCAACGKVLLSVTRPDLGRVRCDGLLLGTFRCLILDGSSPFEVGADEN